MISNKSDKKVNFNLIETVERSKAEWSSSFLSMNCFSSFLISLLLGAPPNRKQEIISDRVH